MASFFGYNFIDQRLEREFKNLLNQIDEPRFNELCAQKFNLDGYALENLLDVNYSFRSREIRKLRKIVFKEFRKFRSYSSLSTGLLRNFYSLFKVKLKHLRRLKINILPRRTPTTGGKIIAFVGVVGSGKLH